LSALLIIDVRHSKIGLVGSSSLVFEVVLEFTPREPFKESLQFESNDVVIVTKSDHELHMVPVAHTQKKVVVNVFAIIERVVNVDCNYSERSWVSQFMGKKLAQRNILFGKVNELLSIV
jgi:hypothetical protein